MKKIIRSLGSLFKKEKNPDLGFNLHTHTLSNTSLIRLNDLLKNRPELLNDLLDVLADHPDQLDYAAKTLKSDLSNFNDVVKNIQQSTRFLL